MIQQWANKRIGIIGGAFDMVHVGHMHLAQIAVKYVDEVWLMPCYKHIHGKEMTADEHRLKMLEIAVEESMPVLAERKKVIVSNYEIRTKSTACTYDGLERLRITTPNCLEFELIIGQDNADAIDTWQKNDVLRRDFPIMVVPRGGYEKTNGAWYEERPHTYLIDEEAMHLSSSSIKEMMKIGRPGTAYVSEGVMKYIVQEGLYGVS